MITFDEFDMRKMVVALDSLQEALMGDGKDVSNLLVDEQRRLTRTIVNFTPPIGGKGGSPKQAGEDAVKRDLYSLISEVRQPLFDEIGSKYGLSDVNTWRSSVNGKIQLVWAHLDPTGDRLAEYHNMYRNNKGRIPGLGTPPSNTWRARVVVPTGVRDPYVKKVQDRVGRWRAKWAFAAASKGDHYPSWISRHFGSVGDGAVSDFSMLEDSKDPSITFGCRGPGAGSNRRKIQDALNFRAKAIGRRVKLILSGYREDIAKGIRARARALKSGEPYEEVQ
jgi:hypothetical protein